MIHGGSDGPVEEILPVEAMRAAIERRDGKLGCPLFTNFYIFLESWTPYGQGGTFMPEECLTLTETISLFSLGVAQGRVRQSWLFFCTFFVNFI